MDHERASGCADSAQEQDPKQTVRPGAADAAAADVSWGQELDRVSGAPELRNRNEICAAEAVEAEYEWFWTTRRFVSDASLRGHGGCAGEDQDGRLAVGARGDAWRKLYWVPWILTSREWRMRSASLRHYFTKMVQMNPTVFADEFAMCGDDEHCCSLLLAQEQMRGEMQRIQQGGLGWCQQAHYLDDQMDLLRQQVQQMSEEQQVAQQMSQQLLVEQQVAQQLSHEQQASQQLPQAQQSARVQ